MCRRIIRCLWILAVVASVAGIVCRGSQIVRSEREYRRSQEEINQIYEDMKHVMVETGEEASVRVGTGQGDETQQKLAWYAALHQKNPDMIGWIRIDGTSINYPVMHTPQDPEFYLNHNFKKEPSSSGMIFMDGACSLEQDSGNFLLYGHHMKNGSMFADLISYESREFWEKHQYVEFNTLKETGTYQVIGALKQSAANAGAEFVNTLWAGTDESRAQLLQLIEDLQFYDTGVEVHDGEGLLVLVTCEYTSDDGRFFVVAKKVDG